MDAFRSKHTPSSSSSREEEINCSRLAEHPAVRAHLSSQRRMHGSMSAERFLSLWDSIVMGGVLGIPGTTSLGANLGQALARKLNIKTGKERETTVRLPCGKVVVAILAHMIREGIEINDTDQFDEGCVLRCTVPTSASTFEGDLEVRIGRLGQGKTELIAKVTFHQKYDWGRANRVLEKLFSAAQGGI
ncbi:hypothetical protein QBC34DRAFT_407334 [Podospora aff. communis PSN243]|uniref:Uncharacterized protein n=1 Tax=Podospora aff. communis PSN243 TaxID=3040156 RepID=A0AAV9GM59_9PEZI|nr:hypothetical protein QBC34DRAFT_407334 [Podospora aff. communis PSN243]